MTNRTLTWEEAFKPEGNNILVELRDDVIANGLVALANYRSRLRLHAQDGVQLNDLNINAILTQFSRDALDHGGVNLPHYRTWLAANTRLQTEAAADQQVEVEAYVADDEHTQAATTEANPMDFTDIGLFGGKLELAKVWINYEGPKTFALHSPAYGFYYIVNAVDDDEDEGNWVRFLAAPVPAALFHAVDAGQVPLRDAFTQDDKVYEITWKWRRDYWHPAVMEMTSQGVPKQWLPLPGAKFRSKPLPRPASSSLAPEARLFLAQLLAEHIASAGPLNIAYAAQQALLEQLRDGS